MSETCAETCALCGRVADTSTDGAATAFGWCADVVEARGGTRTRWLCPQCTREHIRSIEAKLDQHWW